MALKDWKSIIKKKDFVLFKNMKTHATCSILDLPNKKWVFTEYNGKIKVAKDKSQALKFAKLYMRTH